MHMVGKSVSRDDAVKLLEEMRNSGSNLDEILKRVGVNEPANPSVALSERLLQDGKISMLELLNACELELTQNTDLESILVETGLASQAAIDEAKQRLAS
jgi:hypothetical protein